MRRLCKLLQIIDVAGLKAIYPDEGSDPKRSVKSKTISVMEIM